jgi:hypothetical protein
VTVGLLVEITTVTLIVLIFVGHMHALAAWQPQRAKAVWDPLECLEAVAFGLGLGSLLVACGRTAQTAVPRGSGVAAPLWSAAILSWLQFIVLLAGLLVLSDVVFADERKVYRRYTHFAWGCLGLAVGLRWVAGLSAAMALGLVGGVMPNKRIRMRVSKVAIIGQVAGAVGTLLIVLVALAQTTTGRMLSEWSIAYGSASVVGLAFALFLLSALASLSLYTTARRAALEWKPSPEPPK